MRIDEKIRMGKRFQEPIWHIEIHLSEICTITSFMIFDVCVVAVYPHRDFIVGKIRFTDGWPRPKKLAHNPPSINLNNVFHQPVVHYPCYSPMLLRMLSRFWRRQCSSIPRPPRESIPPWRHRGNPCRNVDSSRRCRCKSCRFCSKGSRKEI
jgi:hypothetical protein